MNLVLGNEHAEDRDNRVKHVDVQVTWPDLAESRNPVVQPLAEACPIHATVVSGTEISSSVRTDP